MSLLAPWNFEQARIFRFCLFEMIYNDLVLAGLWLRKPSLSRNLLGLVLCRSIHPRTPFLGMSHTDSEQAPASASLTGSDLYR